MGVDEILEEGPFDKPYRERTVLKHLNIMNSLFKFAARAGHHPESPPPSWELSEELEDDEGWAPFSKPVLETFFQQSYCTRPAVREKNLENFWTPLIALHGGPRLAEICQLYVEDIVEIDGVWCFDINRKKDKSLKSKNSIRIIPIHRFLIELGFLDYAKSVQHERLWPNVKWTKKAGYSKDVGNRMQKMIRRNITEDEDMVFHSFRNTFAEKLSHEARHSDEDIAFILGHEAQYKITQKYRGRKPAHIFKKIIDDFDPGIDLSHLFRQ